MNERAEPAEPDPDVLGQAFGGRYLIEGLLGVGGSASVYEATDLLAEADEPTHVALKVLHPHLSERPRTRDAFLREGRLMAGLQHPNVVGVLGSGLHTADGLPLAWIALDLVRGPSVSEWVERAGPMPPTAAMAVLDGVLAGLEDAHQRGIVHRDVSPHNVLLSGGDQLLPEGRLRPDMVRLIDFGLADASGRDTHGGVLGRGDARHDVIVGNAHYMSPEQALGRPVTASGDLYQAGALLYFALTGRPPYPRATAELVLQAQVSAPPPVPSALVPAARPLDRVVTVAMAKRASERFASASDFRVALSTALTGGIVPIGRTRVLRAAAPPKIADVAHGTTCGASDPRCNDDTSAPPGADGPTPPSSAATPGADSEPPLDYLVSAAPPSKPADSKTAANSASSWSVGGVLATIAALATAIVAVCAVMSPGANSMPASSTPRPTVSPVTSARPVARPSTRSEPSVTESETREGTVSSRVVVPALSGSLDAAEATLNAAGLRRGSVSTVDNVAAAGTVLGQNPVAGDRLPVGGGVNLVVASGANAVPVVTGLSVTAASAVVHSAGFEVAVAIVRTPSVGPVTGVLPVEGTSLTLGATVTLLVRADATTPTGPPKQPSDGPSALPTPEGP